MLESRIKRQAIRQSESLARLCRVRFAFHTHSSRFSPIVSIPDKCPLTYSAVCLFTIAKQSTKQAHSVCETLSEIGVSIPTPTQIGVFEAVMKGEKLEENFKENLKSEHWCLHFERKTIQKKQYQVVVLKNGHI